MSAWLLALVLVQSEEPDPLALAVEMFRAAAPEQQAAIVEEIRQRVEKSDHEGIRRFLRLRDRARRLRSIPYDGPSFFEHSVYAPIQNPRHFIDVSDPEYQRQYELTRPWESDPPFFAVRVSYSYGENKLLRHTYELTPEHDLLDYLGGNGPDTDLVTAWLESRFDHDRSIDALANYFDHAYCDRIGNCFPGITLYDAFASQNPIEMSDIDVIAYAREILDDDSFVSPIPPNARRQKLYDDIKDGFLRYFRHRTLCEAAAWLYLKPDTVIRPDHEGLRRRLLYLFALEDGDVEAIRRRFQKYGDRDGFIEATDRLLEEDDRADAKIAEFSGAATDTRWAVAYIAYDVLREHRMLRGDPR